MGVADSSAEQLQLVGETWVVAELREEEGQVFINLC